MIKWEPWARAAPLVGRAMPFRQPHTETRGVPDSAKWAWSTRHVPHEMDLCVRVPSRAPRAGDVVVIRVRGSGYHSGIVTRDGWRATIYPGDLIVGVMGSRYATDAFEGEIESWEDLYVLTNGGMFGTVRSRNASIREATPVDLVGVVTTNRPVNIKDLCFIPPASNWLPRGMVLVVGAGMNSGKTTSTARLVRQLVTEGRSVGAVKVTGSVSCRDLREYRAAGARHAMDFSDYGFPSTYRCDPAELRSLFTRMVQDAWGRECEVILVEIADGVLQRETQSLLADAQIRDTVAGVLLTAPCSASGLALVNEVRRLGHHLLALTGIITNAPLFMREFSERCDLPVLPTAPACPQLSSLVIESVMRA